MIGAIPTIGTALTKLPSGSSPRCRNGTRSVSDRDNEAEPAAHDEPCQHRLEKRLSEVLPKHAGLSHELMADLGRRGQEDPRNVEPDDDHLPKEQNADPEHRRSEQSPDVSLGGDHLDPIRLIVTRSMPLMP